jgi:methylenetetrahydrofolate dehydrogenase (NADP+)/methenyltetrahydrofolate cyclohydrolase
MIRQGHPGDTGRGSDSLKEIYTMILIDGKETSGIIKQEIAQEVAEIKSAGGTIPHLAIVLVGHDGGSETYVKNKLIACDFVGFRSTLIRYEDTVTEDELINKVRELNDDYSVDGFIVQVPLPEHISEAAILDAIDYRKDVDGFHPVNVGRLALGLPGFISATPAGIIALLRRYHIETSGKECVIIGRSNNVGRPLSILLSQKNPSGNATVTLCHSRSSDIAGICRRADILIAAMGQPGFVRADMVKEGAVVIDVGTTRVPSDQTKSGFKLKGDVDFDNVSPRCSYITPVPGGVGPMTIVSLLRNTLMAARGDIFK